MATRWGIAGAGRISHDFVASIAVLPKNEHTVVAVAAQNLERAKAFAQVHNIGKAYDDYQKLAQDKNVEVVYVGNLNPQHFYVVEMMLNNGKHVLCEKPMTMNAKQTTKLINLAKEKGLFLMEAIWSRCFPVYTTIKKEIDSGRIGEVKQVIVPFGFRLSEVSRLNVKIQGGGSVLDLGVYTLQFASFVYNSDKPLVVKAAGVLNFDGVDESMSATLIYEGGRTATIMSHAGVDMPNEAIIVGTKGTIRVPKFWAATEASFSDGDVVNYPLPESKIKMNHFNSVGLSYEAAEVRRCLLQGLKESPKVPHSESLLIAELEDELRRQIGVVYEEDKM